MNTQNHPTWLVSLEIAKELKAIGFDKPILFHYYEHDFDIIIETNSYYNEGEAQGYLHFYISAFKEENFNRDKKCISLPTWEQVFAWFRAKGYYGNLEATSKGTSAYIFTPEVDYGECWEFAYKESYEEARETLLFKLIDLYKVANQ
jgi:hypothetical protein